MKRPWARRLPTDPDLLFGKIGKRYPQKHRSPRGEGWEHWTYNVLGTKATVDEVDPVAHVRKGLPPTIILQGKDDTVTPLDILSSRLVRINTSLHF